MVVLKQVHVAQDVGVHFCHNGCNTEVHLMLVRNAMLIGIMQRFV